MANVYHFDYISQLLKEKQKGIKESVRSTVKKKRMLNYSEEQLCFKKKNPQP